MPLGMTRKEQWVLLATIGVILIALGIHAWQAEGGADTIHVQGQGTWRRVATVQPDTAPSPSPTPTATPSPTAPPATAVTPPSPTPAPPTTSRPSPAGQPELASIDINGADSVELQRLPGIGPAKATAIVQTRRARAGFPTVDHMLEVKGIGPATLEKVRPYVRVGPYDPAVDAPAPPTGTGR